MPALRAGSLPTIGQSTAELIEGSLKFNYKSYNLLTRTPGSAGNSNNWTLSWWHKRTHGIRRERIFGAGDGSATYGMIVWDSTTTGVMEYEDNGGSGGYDLQYTSTEEMRDVGEWYHFVLVAQTGSSPKMRLYKNGVEVALTANQSGGSSTHINGTLMHEIGQGNNLGGEGSLNLDAYLSQMYMVDGQSLDPTYFGFTDPLTNTWRPKKFNINDAPTADYGTNGFYLPFDGNTPIGEDQSGKGNDWAPVRFGGSNIIDKATGALPALDTQSGGHIALPQVRGNIGVAVTVFNSKYYLDGEEAPSLSKYRGQTITFDQSDSTNASHPLKFATAADAAGSTEYTSGVAYAGTPGTSAYYGVDFDGSDFLKVEQDSSQFSGQGDYTVECWAKFDAFPADGALWSNWNASGSATRSILLEVNSSGGGFRFMINSVGDGGNWITLNATTPIPKIGKWYHLCQTYDHSATTTKCYIDGVFYGQNTSTTVYNDSNADLHIGVNAGDANGKINGQVTNFRWSNSVRYASSFTPSRAPFTTDGNTVFLGCLDSSSATTAVTNTAGTISASGDPSVYSVGDLYGPHTKITIPHTAPNTLYYYCGNHTGMGGSISLSTDERVADPYAWKCLLAIPFVGDATDYSEEINCTSSQKTTRIVNANVQYDSANFYGQSFHFDGSGDWINLETRLPGAWGAADDSYCLEGWVKPEMASGDGQIFYLSSEWNAGDYFYVQRTGDSSGAYKGRGGGGYITAGSNPANGIDAWDHVAYTCDGTTVRLFVNGSLVGSQNQTSYTWLDSYIVRLGANSMNSTGELLTGLMQDLRIYFGTAKYTEDFIPASSIPQITSQTPSGTSYGSEIIKPSDGAVSFDGSGDYLGGASTSEFINDADWTLDGWFYLNSVPSSGGMKFIFDTGGGNNPELGIWLNNSTNPGMLQLYNSLQSGTDWDGPSIAVGRWYYFKETIDGSSSTDSAATYKMYLDGVLCNTTTINLSSRSASVYAVGARSGGSLLWDGFLSNIRYRDIVDNSLGIPSSPFTSDSDTKLLCCQSNGSAWSVAASPAVSGSINDGVVWSQASTYTGPTGGGTDGWNPGAGPELIFDGDITTLASGAGSRDSYFIINFAKSITVSTSLEIYMSGGSSEFKVNDGSYGIQNSGAWRSLSFTGTLTKLSVRGDTGQVHGNNAPRLSAIRIDGSTILTDPVTVYGDSAAYSFNPFNNDTDISSGSKTQYCTYNELDNPGDYNSRRDLSRGNLGVRVGSGNDSGWVQGTLSMPPGHGKKWYWEVEIPAVSNTAGKTYAGIGSRTSQTNAWLDQYCVQLKTAGEPRFYIDGTGYTDKGVGAWSGGSTLGLAFDPDAGILTYYRDGRVLYTQTSISTSGADIPWFPAFQCDPGSTTWTYSNFGQMPFKFPPPDGYEALCVANLPSTGLTRPDKYFTPTLYSGSGSGAQYVSAGFKPDMVWIKSRNNAWYWNCFDSVRGSGKEGTDDAAYYIGCNDTAAQSNVNAVSGTQFQGFYGNDNYGGYIPHYYTGGSGQELNTSGATYVGYCWKAGGGTGAGGEFWKDDKQYANAAAAGLTGGDITPTGASVGTKQGFSIVRYTGNSTANATLPHGLLESPKFVIIKNLSNTYGWAVLHTDVGTTGTTVDGSPEYYMLVLNSDAARDNWSQDTIWNPTSTTVQIDQSGGANWVNNSSSSYIMYAWHDVPGVQKFGHYKATGSTDTAPYIELGFKPALICIKSATTGGTSRNWAIVDSTRSNYNVANHTLAWNLNTAESGFGPGVNMFGSGNEIDLFSNGFKIRDSGNWCNESGATYVYMAWADQPEHNLFGGQSNAR